MNLNHLTLKTMTTYLANELSAKERHEVDEHIAVCPACMHKLEQQRQYEKKLANLISAAPRELHLSSDQFSAVDEAVRLGMKQDPSAEKNWSRRMWKPLLAQAASLLAVIGILAAIFLLTPRSTDTPQEQVPQTVAPTPAPPVATSIPVPAPAPAPVPVSAAAPVTEPTDVPPPVPAPALKPFKQNKDLVRVLGLENIDLSEEKNTPGAALVLIHNAVRFPFQPGVCILYAEAVNDERVTLEIETPAEAPVLTCGKRKIATRAMRLQENESLSDEVRLKIIRRTNEKETETEDIPFPPAVAAFADAPAKVRLAALLHACANPDLILRKKSRTDILGALDQLLAGEYKGHAGLQALAEKIRKIK